MSTTPTLNVTLKGVALGAATNALLAIEGFAERNFPNHGTDPEQARHRNELGTIVLPLRSAMDEAVAAEHLNAKVRGE